MSSAFEVPQVYYVGGKQYRSASEALQRYIRLWEEEHCPIAERKPPYDKDQELVLLVRALLKLACTNRLRRYLKVLRILYKSRKKLQKLLDKYG